jgi:hypothetical protein
MNEADEHSSRKYSYAGSYSVPEGTTEKKGLLFCEVLQILWDVQEEPQASQMPIFFSPFQNEP